MKVLRLIVASEITYVLNVLSSIAGVSLPDRRVVDIPLQPCHYEAARRLAQWFQQCDGQTLLRNSPNAIDVFGVEVVDIPTGKGGG
jgi:hypothetical protein